MVKYHGMRDPEFETVVDCLKRMTGAVELQSIRERWATWDRTRGKPYVYDVALMFCKEQ